MIMRIVLAYIVRSKREITYPFGYIKRDDSICRRKLRIKTVPMTAEGRAWYRK
jgi:hypothetical protein